MQQTPFHAKIPKYRRISACFSIFCVGWDFGFQHYCITFVASYMFADFYRNEMQTSGIDIVLFGTLNGLLYLGLRFYSNIFEPVYHLDNQIVVYLIYFLNTVFAFFFFIMFIYITMITITPRFIINSSKCK